jgi:hypothetical protein
MGLFLRLFTAFVFVLGLAESREGHADSSTPNVDASKLYMSSEAKLYRARVMLEDPRLWSRTYELLRGVLKNDSDLEPPVRKKIEKVVKVLRDEPLRRAGDRILNRRHLVRPFLEAQFLLNEALMDSRPMLNRSNDTEVVYVESLIKSFLFPGFESVGKIVYPDPQSYSFDIYALTPENIAAARVDVPDVQAKKERARDLSPPDDDEDRDGFAPPPTPEDDSIGIGRGGLRPANRMSRLSLERGLELGEEAANEAPAGFIEDAVSAGVAISEISEEIRRLINRLKIPDRVSNQYSKEAMLLQAITEPGSVILDPQLQDFIQGIRLEIPLLTTAALSESEIEEMQQAMGSIASSDGKGVYRIRLKDLLDRPQLGTQTEMELLMKQPTGSARMTLYVVSSIGGEDLARLQLLQGASLLLRDARVLSALGSRATQTKALAALLAQVKELGRVMTAVSEVTGPKVKALKSVLSFVGRTGGWAGRTASSASSKLVGVLSDQPIVKSGRLFTILTLVAVAAEITVSSIEYAHADNESDKRRIYINGHSRVSATLLYMVPYLGLGLVLVDSAHAFFGFPFETADAIRALHWGAESGFTMLLTGKTPTTLELQKIEMSLGIPQLEGSFERFARHSGAGDEIRMNLMGLFDQMRSVALRHMTFVWIAHRGVAKQTNNPYGRRLELHMKIFDETRAVFAGVRDQLRRDLQSLAPVAP